MMKTLTLTADQIDTLKSILCDEFDRLGNEEIDAVGMEHTAVCCLMSDVDSILSMLESE